MTRWLPGAVETEADLPAFCGMCGRRMKRRDREGFFDRFTGHQNDGQPAVECPKWYRNPARHEAFIVNPRPAPPPMPPRCTCQKTPHGLIPTTVNCPIHGSWTYTPSSTGLVG